MNMKITAWIQALMSRTLLDSFSSNQEKKDVIKDGRKKMVCVKV